MIERIQKIAKETDYFLLFLMVIFMTISFFAIYSAVYDVSTGEVQPLPYKQLKIFMLGLLSFFVISVIDYRRLMQVAILFYIAGCISLLLVDILGVTRMGAQRWLEIGGFRFQPSEMFKFIWVLMLGWVFSDIEASPIGFIKLAKKIAWLAIPCWLVFLQPDLGTMFTYVVVWSIVAVFLSIRKMIYVLVIAMMLVSVPVVWTQVLKDYQKRRVMAFIAPDKHPDTGYQAIQSRIAIGSGGLTGKGFLKGTQSHLRFMPERHNDFIYAVINEEFGFVGGGAIIMLFFILLVRIVQTATVLREPRGKAMCIAVAGFIFFHCFVNIGMTIGLVPVVGIPLPFISQGGSSLVVFMSMLGLVNSAYIARFDKGE